VRRNRPPILVLVLLVTTTSLPALGDLNPSRQAELTYLLRHDCGSCHGMWLEGGLGPPLKPEDLRHWSVEQLALTILYGRPGTPMPPWRPFLSPPEAQWLAKSLKQGIAP